MIKILLSLLIFAGISFAQHDDYDSYDYNDALEYELNKPIYPPIYYHMRDSLINAYSNQNQQTTPTYSQYVQQQQNQYQQQYVPQQYQPTVPTVNQVQMTYHSVAACEGEQCDKPIDKIEHIIINYNNVNAAIAIQSNNLIFTPQNINAVKVRNRANRINQYQEATYIDDSGMLVYIVIWKTGLFIQYSNIRLMFLTCDENSACQCYLSGCQQ